MFATKPLELPLATSDVEIITPATARQWRDTKAFERQRTINERNVARLAIEMVAGRFIIGTQIYICVLPNGNELIINGNHTLEAVVESDTPQHLTVTRKHVANIDEAGRIYAVFDIHKARTWLDSLKAVGKSDNIKMSSKALAALGVIEANFAHTHPAYAPSRIGRIERLVEYEDAIDLFQIAINGGVADAVRFAMRAAMMAIALEALRSQPSAASEFWFRFAHDDGLAKGMPERALLTWCRNNKNATGFQGRRESARAAALAWNASFKGRSLEVCKPNQMSAFFLLGTPYEQGFAGAERQA